jgi:hypothetical protein
MQNRKLKSNFEQRQCVLNCSAFVPQQQPALVHKCKLLPDTVEHNHRLNSSAVRLLWCYLIELTPLIYHSVRALVLRTTYSEGQPECVVI